MCGQTCGLGGGLRGGTVRVNGGDPLAPGAGSAVDELTGDIDGGAGPRITGAGALEQQENTLRRLDDVTSDGAQLIVGGLEVAGHDRHLAILPSPLDSAGRPPHRCLGVR